MSDTLHWLSASDLFAVLGDFAPSSDLTASKTADCINRDGSQITGFVVTDKCGGIGIIDKSAVRWLTNKEMWWLMHTSAERGGDLDTPRTDANESVTCKEGDPCIVPDFARQLERELNAAKAELAELKKVIRKIYYETETYADGAPDATDHDKLCNEVSSQLEPYIK